MAAHAAKPLYFAFPIKAVITCTLSRNSNEIVVIRLKPPTTTTTTYRVGTTTRTHLFCRPPFPFQGEGPGMGSLTPNTRCRRRDKQHSPFCHSDPAKNPPGSPPCLRDLLFVGIATSPGGRGYRG